MIVQGATARSDGAFGPCDPGYFPSDHPRWFAGFRQSRFARRLLNVPNAPYDVVPCGGISDGAFAGTPHRWSTGEPSLPVALITQYKSAGPSVVLDEIEKVDTSCFNGQVQTRC